MITSEQKEIIPYHRPFPLPKQELQEYLEKAKEVITSGILTNGKYVRKLEYEIQKRYSVEYVVATSSCTQGLLYALYCVKENYRVSEIQIPVFNWWSALYACRFLNLSPIYVDIDKKSWLPKIKYPRLPVLYLHTFGNVGYYKNDEKVVFDAAHCLGADFSQIGIATVVSLAPTKLVTSCEGGLILTKDRKSYVIMKELRDKCGRMSELHALYALFTLKYLKEIMKWKRHVFMYYKTYLPGQFQEKRYAHNYNTIGFLNTERLKIPEHIETRQYYEPLIRGDEFSNTDEVYKRMICLPSYYNCPYEQIVKEIKELNEKEI